MGTIIKLVRNALGGVIAFFDIITRGPKLKRTQHIQEQVEREVQDLTLYQFFACPFCIKTRRVMHKMNLPIEKCSAEKGSEYRDELLQGGGKIQVPCLRIKKAGEFEWLYDSSEIIKYLKRRFG